MPYISKRHCKPGIKSSENPTCKCMWRINIFSISLNLPTQLPFARMPPSREGSAEVSQVCFPPGTAKLRTSRCQIKCPAALSHRLLESFRGIAVFLLQTEQVLRGALQALRHPGVSWDLGTSWHICCLGFCRWMGFKGWCDEFELYPCGYVPI